jgi:hypothetical protein
VILVSESCLLVDYTGHLPSVLRDSAVDLRKYFFFEYNPLKDAKTKRTFKGDSRYFRTFKVPTKADGGKPSFIWTQWTWKPSPRSIGFDGDENGQHEEKREAGGQGEFSVGLAARRDVASQPAT